MTGAPDAHRRFGGLLRERNFRLPWSGETVSGGSGSVASLSGRALAGLAAEAVGYAAALLFNSASFIVSAVCLFAIKAESPAHSREVRVTTIRADIAEGQREGSRELLEALTPACSTR